MKSLKLIYISVALIFVLTLLAELTKTKDIDWTPTFRLNDKNPYGLYIFGKIIDGYFQNHKVQVYSKTFFEYRKEHNFRVFDANSNNSEYGKNFILIAGDTKFSEGDFEDIKEILKEGNNIFIASTNFGKMAGNLGFDTEILNYLAYPLSKVENNDEKIVFTNKFNRTDSIYNLPVGQSVYFNTDSLKVNCNLLMKTETGYSLMLKTDIYGGNLFLMSLPFTFANVNLMEQQPRKIAENCLSFLPDKETVIFDYYAIGGTENSPLKFILKEDSLRAAYYVLILSALFFMIFGIKRNQRIIPVLYKPVNSSAEFISTIAKLSFSVRDNKHTAQKKINHFYIYLKNNLNIPFFSPDESFFEILAGKSGLSVEKIKKIFDLINDVNASAKIKDDKLELICKEIDIFYKKVNI